MRYPLDWSDVTIKQYYDLLDVLKIDSDDESKSLLILSSLTGITVEDLESKHPVKDVKAAIQAMAFVGKKSKYSPKVILRLKRRKFQFNFNLKEALAGSFISLSDYCKNDKANENIHNVLAIFCDELNFWGFKKKKTIVTQKEIAEYFLNNLTMDKAFAYSDFFLSNYNRLLKATRDYLIRKKRKIQRQLLKMADQVS